MDTNQLVDALLSAASHGQWIAVFSLALVALTAAMRWVGPKFHDRLGAFVTSDRGGQIVALINGVGLALAAAATSGKPITLQLCIGAVIAGVGAGGGYNLFKNVFSPSDKKAVVAGKTVTVAPAPKVGGGFVNVRLVLILAGLGMVGTALLIPGCSSCQVPAPTTAQWKTAGVDSAKCIAPAILNAAGDAIVAALNQAAGASVDFKTVGIGLAKTYGSQAAVCAIGKLWLDLGGPNLFAMHGQPTPALLLTDWLIHNQSSWLPSTSSPSTPSLQ